MTHIGGALVTVGAVVALLLGGAADAGAEPTPWPRPAKGAFVYTEHGTEKRLRDPKNNRCYAIEGRGAAENRTNRVAKLYRNADCRGKPVTSIAPRERERHVVFRSVLFER
ncbi:hypothetical protein NDR87_21945 [Nocardia sp. CDC159]|uniref:Secreted protein n=1 Tax=Nocardia pulmonis TaxID=2951408 RepID=A0A9X2E9L0_9NOCA|nr:MULTISPECIES: hypothetical protein [Nocardia]MCM6776817.1 hypothetical protein [Nocardia pulmonis]MCM6789034.1 hypothetical protein [Nocardia sp. CDC159]